MVCCWGGGFAGGIGGEGDRRGEDTKSSKSSSVDDTGLDELVGS
jgi:hypothetical protein